ncbi:hypothetical protein BDV95DRAFT_229127 [Massariosphaeria phaeospora]|uniref:Uncharacterized protein n=1 Tax=Massariosphaeria phaeospora TaxID=100035 RepID=A0A7C8MGU8_9PLEO|nr:hypothetical protein BDV95DRAFT_229127 [Massariosphaeria phaeospora]
MRAETLPPCRQLADTPSSLENAEALLSTFLTESESHPHLHPDAVLTPTGAAFSSHGGPTGGMVMHSLRRVAAGLRGEYLEPEVAEADLHAQSPHGNGSNIYTSADAIAAAAEEGWQDMSEYEREAGVDEVGDLGARTSAVLPADKGMAIAATDGAEAGEADRKKRKTADPDAHMNKAARKAAKKARQKETRRDKEKKKAYKGE